MFFFAFLAFFAFFGKVMATRFFGKRWPPEFLAGQNVIPRSLREHLLHAVEAYAMYELHPSAVLRFDVRYPSQSNFSDRCVMHLGLPPGTTSLGFDGMFGVHRALQKGVDVRTSMPVGRPRTKYYKDARGILRTASCKTKAKVRATLPNRTAGWLFCTDCRKGDGCVVAGCELINNESCKDKDSLIRSILHRRGGGRVTTLVHDDMCHFCEYVRKHNPASYKRVKVWLIDTWHRKNHVDTCKFKKLHRGHKSLLKQMNTSRAEQFNSYIRRSNAFLNGLRSASHRFWVYRLMLHFNASRPTVSQCGRGRTNAASRGSLGHRKKGKHCPAKKSTAGKSRPV